MANSAFDILQEEDLRIGLCSRGIAKIKHLDLFLQSTNATFKRVNSAGDADLFIGWGNKPSGKKAVQLANHSGKPYLLLEDAFIRSYAPQSVSNEPALGLVLDDQGIYYDASGPSRLENLIKENATNVDAIANGTKLINHLAANQISKYNNFDLNMTTNTGKSAVLVIDQTFQDQSVSGAGANDNAFTQMLEAAIDENPGTEIIVKLHPEVLAGKKQGYLKDLAIKHGCNLLAANINPWHLFEHVSSVYTVSSQLGFDALMAGCKVRCFAMPFYAGWGLTHDEKTCDRRQNTNTSLPTLADAALTKYARYKSAHDHISCDAYQTATQISQIRDAYNQNNTMAAFYQVTPWKWGRVKAMFKPNGTGQTFFLTKTAAINSAKKRSGSLVAWASRIDGQFEKDCQAEGIDLQRLEDGFIRSVGLGTNFHLPMSLIVDDLGIYYDSTRTSRLEQMLENHSFQSIELERAEKLIDNIIENEINKYNLGEVLAMEDLLPDDQTIILVPGQVDDDASIKLGGSGMTSLKLLTQVRANNPDAFIIFKAHPDVTSGQRPGLHDPKVIAKYSDTQTSDMNINQLIAVCDEVHTISSLTGFEALLRGKKVHCYGLPFYAGWGLTTDRVNTARRTRTLTLEMLVSATLIKYPRYYDPVSSLPCGPEQVIKRIMEQQENPTPPSLLIRGRSFFGKLRARLR